MSVIQAAEPYISIVLPGSTTPIERASAAASDTPVVTGVPATSPVAAAPASVILPAISLVQFSVGSCSGAQIPSHIFAFHRCAEGSYIGA